MRVSPDDLFVDFEPAWVLSLMEHWSWLLDPLPSEILRVTSLGDVFYGTENGVRFLDTNGCAKGSSFVAEDADELTQLSTSEQFSRDYLCPQFVGDLIESHGQLAPSMCYSREDYSRSHEDPSNYHIADIGLHLTLSGMLRCLGNRLPDNEPFDWKTLKNERRRFARIIRESYPRILNEKRPRQCP